MESENLSLTQRWLRQNIQTYLNRDIVYLHVDAVLADHPTLRPKTDVYTYDDGRSQLMLCVHGLLPIIYRSASYNIPVAMWLPRNYPKEPPLIYVVPTSDMLVKASKYVDVSGRCEPPYCHSWIKKSEGCNLNSLVEVLTEQFSHEPPLYARPRAVSPPRGGVDNVPISPPSQQQAVTEPRSNYATRSSPQIAYATRPPPQIDYATRPPLQIDYATRPPPQPTSLRPTEAPSSGQFIQSPTMPQPLAVQAPPVYRSPQSHNSPATYHPPPPVPPPHPQSPPPSLPAQLPRQYASPSRSPAPPPQPYSSPPVQHYASPLHTPQRSQEYAPQQYPSSPPHQYEPTPPPPQVPPPRPTPNLLDEEDPTPSSLPVPPPSSAPPPPRPPNPEILRLQSMVHAKLTQAFDHLATSLASDTGRLQAAQADLLAGEPAIKDEMARLEAVRDVCRAVGAKMRGTVQRAEMTIDEVKKKCDPEVDELICGTTIVYNQLIDLVAEDNAIEDTIYHLHRALNAGRIDLEKFLRTTRSLAEEQFMKRALAEKIVASIPMGAWS